MKNKNTKQMWVYACFLFVIALALIVLTTIMQWKLVPESNNLQLLDTLTQNTTDRINQLNQENIDLTNALTKKQNELTELINSYNTLSSEYETLKNDKAFLDASNKKLYNLINAYIKNDFESVREQIKEFSKEELDSILPGFYDMANKL